MKGTNATYLWFSATYNGDIYSGNRNYHTSKEGSVM